jgi:uncharacterized SAM-binding protein YcdF (DUF218 family)
LTGDVITPEQAVIITAYVDIEAPPPAGEPAAVLIFGTNQLLPAAGIAAGRYHRGLAPLIITTGGVNRHTGIIEAREFRRVLLGNDVPDDAIRVEDQSANTWQNVEYALPHLREALAAGLPVTAIAEWYHRRAVHMLKTLVPDVGPVHVITWEPVYDGQPVTRSNWPDVPGGHRRVVREWEEVTRRTADGSLTDAAKAGGAWV